MTIDNAASNYSIFTGVLSAVILVAFIIVGILCVVSLEMQGASFSIPNSFFVISIILNCVSCIALIYKHFCPDQGDASYKGDTFSKYKRISMYIFAGFHMFHCAYYVFLPNTNLTARLMNVSIIVYIRLLFLRFRSFKHLMGPQVAMSILIYCANNVNILIPLLENTYVSSCNKNSTFIDIDYTPSRPEEVLEKVYPLLLPGIIGFSVLVFDYTFHGIKPLSSENQSKRKFLKSLGYHILLFLFFALFCFLFSEQLTHFPLSEFKILIIIQIILKGLIILITFFLFCNSVLNKISLSLLNAWIVQLWINVVFSIIFHIFVLVDIDGKDLHDIYIANNSIGIFAVILQALYLTCLSKPQCSEICNECLFFFLGIINMCLLISECANSCLLYTSPSPRDLSTSRMPSSA